METLFQENFDSNFLLAHLVLNEINSCSTRNISVEIKHKFQCGIEIKMEIGWLKENETEGQLHERESK